jgi:glycosyltransferase involved in cell wall biosynthesis
MVSGRPCVLAVLPGFIPSTIIGVVKPLLRLHHTAEIELDISLEHLVQRRRLEWADVVVFCRNVEPKYGRVLEGAVELGKPIIYELDDNLLEVPDTTPELRLLGVPQRQAQVKQYLRQANLIRVYSPVLQRYLAAYNPCVVTINGPLDWSLLPGQPCRRDPHRVRLVYVTSRLEDAVGQMLVDPLQRVLSAFPQVEVTIWGPQLSALQGQPRVRHMAFIADYDRFFYAFARQGFDIGLAPLPDDLFYQCKSNNKFREYAACSVAGIYSDTEVYHACVVDGVTGLLVGPHADAWVEAMARLIEDVPLREAIQGQAKAFARQNYNQDRMQADWLVHIQQVLAGGLISLGGVKVYPGGLGRGKLPGISRAGALLSGILRRTIHHGFKLIPSLKNRGLDVTSGLVHVHMNNFKQLILLKIILWYSRHRPPKNPKPVDKNGSLG